ncbi:LysR family transcriptional regulator [Roseobacter sp. YSTF-M11]|uniref:LysR family transcriptional regulator n=1 Tax=Roseobacter insulae TaxID=2859783 RepID=A0A9X1FRR8_9RHOB|nr:LysR family transcriptional regulator [Roseobacter insulae]
MTQGANLTGRQDVFGIGDGFGYRDFIVILAVAETGSFRGAAQRLSQGQSAVSRRVQRLEDHLGVSLFERSPTGARLTPAGSNFTSRVRAVLHDIDYAIASARTAGVAGNGHLCIGMTSSFSRGPILSLFAEFTERHRGIEVGVTETNQSELLTLLSHRRLDVVILSEAPTPENGDGLLISRERPYLAVARDSSLSGRETINWDEISAQPFLVSSSCSGTQVADLILQRTADQRVLPHIKRHRAEHETLLSLVSLGLGVTVVMERRLGATIPGVSFIPIGGQDEAVPTSVIWRPENDNPALRRFISLARIEAKRNGALS